MKFNLWILGSVAGLYSAGTSFGQITLLNEDFSTGIPSTWAVVNADGLTPHADVAEFTNGWIQFIDDDTSAASTSYYDSTGQSQDYLILPKLSLLSFSKLVWSGRSVDASYPDSYYVLISSTDSLPASFTDTLMAVLNESYLWQTYSILLDTAGYASQDVYIAFRNFTTDGFILELDDIKVFTDDNAGVHLLTAVASTLFPNPASTTVEVRHGMTGQVCNEIFDSQGRLVLSFATEILDVSTLSPGIYTVRSRSGTQVATSKLIKT